MTDEQTRQPRSPEDYATMIMQTLAANSMAEAYSKVSELAAIKPLVWVRPDGAIQIVPMKVRDVAALIAALEGLTVQ